MRHHQPLTTYTTMQVFVSHSVLGRSFRSCSKVLQCVEHIPFGYNNYALLDAGAFLESKAQEGRSQGFDVFVRPLTVAWIDGTRVAQCWDIELMEARA